MSGEAFLPDGTALSGHPPRVLDTGIRINHIKPGLTFWRPKTVFIYLSDITEQTVLEDESLPPGQQRVSLYADHPSPRPLASSAPVQDLNHQQMGNESSIAQRECGFFPYEHCGFGDRNCCAQEKQRNAQEKQRNSKPAFSHIVHTFDNKQSKGGNSRIWVEAATGPAVPVPLGPDFGNPFRQHSSSSGSSSTHTRTPRSATFAESLPKTKELPQNIVAAAWV